MDIIISFIFLQDSEKDQFTSYEAVHNYKKSQVYSTLKALLSYSPTLMHCFIIFLIF